MTNQEAIKILYNLKPGDYSNPYEKGEAILMAISALQAQPDLQSTDNELATDTISRKAAINAVENIDCSDGVGISALKCEAVDDMVIAIKALPSTQSKSHWIPINERLPKEGERVLATHLGGINPNNQVIEHIYQYGKFTYGWDMDMNIDSPTFGQRYMGEVIAWMPFPFPEPYREEENE